MIHRGPFQPLPFCDSVILTVVTSVLTACNSADLIRITPDLYPGGEKSESDQELGTYIIFSTKYPLFCKAQELLQGP